MPRPSLTAALLIAPALFAAAVPASAQLSQSQGYKFLQAVKDGKNDEVIQALSKPGSTIVNARDVTSGDGALAIVIKRGDMAYLNYLLQMGADPNLRDGKGNTPLLLAVTEGETDMIPVLAKAKANPNLGNAGGETPLIRAVQRRDLAMVRALLAAGSDPDQRDSLAGLSARDYATQDQRNLPIAKIFAETPKTAKRAVAGPKF
ncbi:MULTISPECIES: ankyrin repeat domain-containing protein [unclassified Sphingomonas]|uniref:ankyrin repeat domain-containing protein n=1 Tax=unclassified Sphingomonas TaxID=196159 RepID=UPI002269BD0E|nr:MULTISPECIES: ankyrin repeat domain-containing protein [unclassified Sphingomonas]